jgi:MYXO-CTERM domain-containing protein
MRRDLTVLRASMLAAALAIPAAARAEQIVLFDTTYTHTNANDSHHSMSGAALNQPQNWTSPIDYSNGTIHFYQEVMTKPSNRETIIDFCLISQKDYGCIETFIYTTTGLHETVRSMSGKDVDKRNVIDFTKPMKSIQMVLKTPAPTYINGGSPQSDFLPSQMRFVATLVSPGGTYIKPTPTPGFNAGDGGVVMMTADASAPVADGAVVAADAASLEPDVAAVTPPPAKPDAAPVTPPVRADAAAKPPSMNPPSEDPPVDEPTSPPAKRGKSGCSYGGGAPGALALLVVAAALVRVRRRRV